MASSSSALTVSLSSCAASIACATFPSKFSSVLRQTWCNHTWRNFSVSRRLEMLCRMHPIQSVGSSACSTHKSSVSRNTGRSFQAELLASAKTHAQTGALTRTLMVSSTLSSRIVALCGLTACHHLALRSQKKFWARRAFTSFQMTKLRFCQLVFSFHRLMSSCLGASATSFQTLPATL